MHLESSLKTVAKSSEEWKGRGTENERQTTRRSKDGMKETKRARRVQNESKS